MLAPTVESGRRGPWNKGKLVGQKSPLKLKEIWAIRVRLELADRKRELALFNLAIDSKLRGCDLVQLRVRDVAHGDRIAARTIVMQQKTQRPVQFEITVARHPKIALRLDSARSTENGGLPVSEQDTVVSTSVDPAIRPDSRNVGGRNWFGCWCLRNPFMRRTKPSLIYRRTKNLRRVVQLLLGHTKLDYLPCRTMSRCDDSAGFSMR